MLKPPKSVFSATDSHKGTFYTLPSWKECMVDLEHFYWFEIYLYLRKPFNVVFAKKTTMPSQQ